VTFDQIKPKREVYSEKSIEIEGQIKDLKVIKENGNKFATFFLSNGTDPETISVKVNLMKRKTVINTFECANGEFTTVSGRFKPWGNASYFGKIEMRESFQFNCTKTAQHKAPPVVVAKAIAPKKVEVTKKSEKVVVDVPMPVLVSMGTGSGGKILDENGKSITKVAQFQTSFALLEKSFYIRNVMEYIGEQNGGKTLIRIRHLGCIHHTVNPRVRNDVGGF
jgi:hypothetical protein